MLSKFNFASLTHISITQLKGNIMKKLEQIRDRAILRHGKEAEIVQNLNRQIMAEKSGQSFQDLYVTGSYTKPKEDKKDK